MKKLFAALLTLMTIIHASADNGVYGILSDYLNDGSIDSSSTAVYVYDLKSKKTVLAHNENLPLIGASTMKAVTIASLYESVDMEYTYNTRVYIQGGVSFGVLNGNIVIKSTGDPTINSDRDPITPSIVKEITDAVKNEKINIIHGNIIVDETVFGGSSTPASWAEGDKRQYYGTGSHGFNFERNKSGNASVSDPKGVFIQRLKSSLSTSGIRFESSDGAVVKGEREIMCHKSGTMDEIMRSCMMRSDNLYAECLLRTLAVVKHQDGSTAAGAALSYDFWKGRGAPMEGVCFKDGSGLSRSNRLTAKFLGFVLREMSGYPYYASFFPLAGEEGTLKNFLKNSSLTAYIAMKTGSMNGVQAYAGYKLDDDYEPTHVVVVIINKFPSSRDAAKRATARMLLNIFDN